jgi:hypothetical protein
VTVRILRYSAGSFGATVYCRAEFVPMLVPTVGSGFGVE